MPPKQCSLGSTSTDMTYCSAPGEPNLNAHPEAKQGALYPSSACRTVHLGIQVPPDLCMSPFHGVHTSVSSRSTFSRVAACMVASKCASLSCFCSARICCSIWSPARSRWLMCCCSCCTSCKSNGRCCYRLSHARHVLLALPVLLHLAAPRLSDGTVQYSTSAEAALSWWVQQLTQTFRGSDFAAEEQRQGCIQLLDPRVAPALKTELLPCHPCSVVMIHVHSPRALGAILSSSKYSSLRKAAWLA